MTLLLDNEFQPLPPDKAVDTKLFLEAVSHLPSFFGEYGPPEVGLVCVTAPTFAYFLVALTATKPDVAKKE